MGHKEFVWSLSLLCKPKDVHICIFIQLEAKLQPNIGFTLQHVLAVFTRSAVTPPKVNRFL